MTITTSLIASARLGIAGLGLTVQAFLPATPAATLTPASPPDLDLVVNSNKLPQLELAALNHQTGELTKELSLNLTPNEPKVIAQATPIPHLTIKPLSHPDSPYEAVFAQYAAQFGVPAEVLKKIAWCESHYHPDSVNLKGGYGGMFQFSLSTWQSTRRQMGMDSNPDLRFDPEQAILTAAYKIAAGGIHSWPVCSR